MALARLAFDATNDTGDLLSNVTVEVRNEVTNALAVCYSDRAGTVSIGNPFVVANGEIGFHVVGGAYKIILTAGSYTRTRRYVAVGLAAEMDGLGNLSFDTVAELIADTTLTYTAGSATSVIAGNYLTAQGFRYQVAASAVTDQHVITAGGVKLYVVLGDRAALDIRAFGATGSGTETSVVVTAAIACSILGVDLDFGDLTITVDGLVISSLAYVGWFSSGFGGLALANGSNTATVLIQGCTDIHVRNIEVDGNKANQVLASMASRLNGVGLMISGFDTVRVHSNKIHDTACGAGILVEDPSTSGNVRNHTNSWGEVYGNTLLDLGKGIGALFTCDGIYTQANNLKIHDNTIIGFNDYGIVGEFSSNIDIYDNTIDGLYEGVMGVSVQGVFNFSERGNNTRNVAAGLAAFTQSNPVADPYFNTFGVIENNKAINIGNPVIAGFNTGVIVGQSGATITIYAGAPGSSGNTIPVTGSGTFGVPTGSVLAGGAFGCVAWGVVSLTSVVAGNILTVNSIIYTAVGSGATGNQFNIGTTDIETAESLALSIMGGAAGVKAVVGSQIKVMGNTTSGGERGIVFNAHFGDVTNNTARGTTFETHRVQGYSVNTAIKQLSSGETSYTNVTRGAVDEKRNNIQRRAFTGTAVSPAYYRPVWVKTDDVSGSVSSVVVINASGLHPTSGAPVFVQRRLLIKSVAGVVSVTDFDAGPVGDTTLLTVTAGPNGAGRAEVLASPSVGTMTINIDVELIALDVNSPMYLNEI